MSHITTTSTTATPPTTVQPRLERLVQAFGQHADWQNVFRLALGQLQNDKRDVEKQRLALWLLQAGNPYLVLDSIKTENLVLDPMLNRLTRWLVHLDYTGSTDFSNEWKPDDKRPELHEFVFENVRVAHVVTSLLHRDNRDSRVLISAWELLKSADITKSPKLQAARTAFLSEFRTLAGLPTNPKRQRGRVFSRLWRLIQQLWSSWFSGASALAHTSGYGQEPTPDAYDDNFDPVREAEKRLARTLLLGPNYARCPAVKDFLIGSDPSDDNQRYENEGPRHPVTLSEFHLQTTPITTAQFALFDPRHEKRFGTEYRKRSPDDDCPAIYVNWHMAELFCVWLSGLAIDDPRAKTVYRLPTEAEWEYACRGGVRDYRKWCFGNDESKLAEYAWYYKNSGNRTHAVATREKNDLGLYDMHGNVWEWCRDGKREYSLEPQRNPVGPEDQDYRVLRGGAFWGVTWLCRSAYRYGDRPTFSNLNAGFRVCVAAPQD